MRKCLSVERHQMQADSVMEALLHFVEKNRTRSLWEGSGRYGRMPEVGQ